MITLSSALLTPPATSSTIRARCANPERIDVARVNSDVVAASGDRQLLAAWRALGMNTLDVNAGPG